MEEALEGVHKHEDGESYTPECWPKDESLYDEQRLANNVKEMYLRGRQS